MNNSMTTLSSQNQSRSIKALILTLTVSLISACSGGGAPVEETPITSAPPSTGYNGPAPASADVQAFRLNLWDNIQAEAGCGACHGTGGQAPTFARDDDINLAYAEANTVVDLMSPENSRLSTKVGGGHNCWESSDAACADRMTTWISRWAGELVAGGGRTIDLEPPVIREPGSSRNFPADSALFGSTVHPVLTQYCAGCHASSAPNAQGPFFGEGDLDTAYDASRPRIDLNITADSRFVVRLREEFHNCWSDCLSNANEMQAAIDAMAGNIAPTQVDPSLTISRALSIVDGVVASGGSRYEANAIATYEFKAGEGVTAFDTSGITPSLDLTLSGDYNWVGGWGVTLRDGKAQARVADSAKLHDMIKATGEYSIEAWVVPANVTQEESRIVSYSAGPDARNFTLFQNLYDYDFANRSSVTDANGMPALSTPDADEVLQATLQHVVANYDPVNGRSIYVNGQRIDITDEQGGGSIADWDNTYAFVLGSEASNNGRFAGTYRFVSIHNRVLTDEQIFQNFDAGVGEKFYLLFSVAHLIDVPDAYVLFEVSQFDNYSYLFNAPHFISLDQNASFANIPIEGIRIGLNGDEVPVGQTYRTVSTTLDSTLVEELGQPLSNLGTVIALEQGPEGDEFFLSFDVLGNNVNVRTDPVPLAPPPPVDLVPVADIGVRTFEEIAATMSAVTGIPRTNPDVMTTYELVQQQMPVAPALDGFLASNQVGIAQLSVEYCNALLNDTGRRATYFPGLDFSASANAAFGSQAGRNLLIDPLVDGIVGVNLASQPNRADVEGELNNLITRLTACGNNCAADRTQTVGIAVCSAALGSAAMLVQ
ncbi:MAG: LamG domain-containing protein [Pseudomonadota bacterium]